MTALGCMGREASKFYSRLSESISKKRKERFSVIKLDITENINLFDQLCLHVCERGSRSIYPLRDIDLENDPCTSEMQVHMS